LAKRGVFPRGNSIADGKIQVVLQKCNRGHNTMFLSINKGFQRGMLKSGKLSTPCFQRRILLVYWIIPYISYAKIIYPH
jgi:hypothetical protein